MKLFLIVIGCFMSFALTAQANTASVYNENMPMPAGACQLNHAELIEEFSEGAFEKMRSQGKVAKNDQLRLVTPLRQPPELSPEQGATPYALDMYGRTADTKEDRIPPVDEQDNPNGTRNYRCYGRVMVTASCEVKFIPMDMMDAEDFAYQAEEYLKYRKNYGPDSQEPAPLEEYGKFSIGIPQIKISKKQGMTCNRPRARVSS